MRERGEAGGVGTVLKECRGDWRGRSEAGLGGMRVGRRLTVAVERLPLVVLCAV